jgi:hypothetical protein
MVHAALLLLLSPALAAERSVGPGVFPDGAEWWDRVGMFEVGDGDTARRVLVYCHDTDSVMEKEMARKGSAMGFYPNSFTLHAVYETAPGRWALAEPHTVGRVRLNKATAVGGGVEVELRGNSRIWIEPGKDNTKAYEEGRRQNKPVTKKVWIKDGAVTVK